MQITRRADYAVRTMLDVARVQPGTMALTHEVAAMQGIPTPFLAKIVLSLTRGGLLKSFRGSGGGIVLAKTAEEISLLRIVEAVDGPIAINRCVPWPEECNRSPCVRFTRSGARRGMPWQSDWRAPVWPQWLGKQKAWKPLAQRLILPWAALLDR